MSIDLVVFMDYSKNMKRNILLSIILLFLLANCTTTVSMNTLVPSEINLGPNQVIAVAPTEYKKTYRYPRRIPVYVEENIPVPKELKNLSSFEGLDTESNVARYASRTIYEALAEGVYTIVDLNAVSRYQGATLLLNSSVDAMIYDEFITAKEVKEKDGSSYYLYYLVQKASISISYVLQDARTRKAVDANVYSGKFPSYDYEHETLIAKMDSNKKVTLYTDSVSSAETIYKSIIARFKNEIRNRLVPHYETLRFNLLSGDRDSGYSDINKLVEEGYMSIAFDKYYDIYNKTGDVVAAYNCSVLYYAMGYQSEAIQFAKDVYTKTYNTELGKLLQRMQLAYNSEQDAIKQVTK